MDLSNIKEVRVKDEPIDEDSYNPEYDNYGNELLKLEVTEEKFGQSDDSCSEDNVNMAEGFAYRENENMDLNNINEVRIKDEPIDEDSDTPEYANYGDEWLKLEVKEEKYGESDNSCSENNANMAEDLFVSADALPSTTGFDSPTRGDFEVNLKHEPSENAGDLINESDEKYSMDIKTETGPTQEKSHNQSFSVSSKLRIKLKHPKNKKTTCDTCGKSFSRSDNLKRHLVVHTVKKPHQCHICGKSFACPTSLKTHVEIHPNERPHSCKFCPRTFTDRTNLRRHIRTHTNEKPYNCRFCPKSFADPTNLRRHTRIHTNEKPYNCSFCPKTFTQSSNLKSHLLTQHKESNELKAAEPV